MPTHEIIYKIFQKSYYKAPLKQESGPGAKFQTKKNKSQASDSSNKPDQPVSLSTLVDVSDLRLIGWEPKDIVPYYDYGQFLVVSDKVKRLFRNRLKKDLETVEVELFEPTGDLIPLNTKYYALRSTKVLDCIDLELSADYLGKTFSDSLALQQRYDDMLARGEKPDFDRPDTPQLFMSERIVLKPGPIPPDSIFFCPKNIDGTFIETRFAKALLKKVVAEGGDEECSFWLLDPERPFANYEDICEEVGGDVTSSEPD